MGGWPDFQKLNWHMISPDLDMAAVISKLRYSAPVNLIALYLLSIGFVAGSDRFGSLDNKKHWWRFVQDTDFDAEINKIKLDKADIRSGLKHLIKDLKNELKQETMDLPKIVTPLIEKLSEIEQNGGFI
jgi:hypothetical protein